MWPGLVTRVSIVQFPRNPTFARVSVTLSIGFTTRRASPEFPDQPQPPQLPQHLHQPVATLPVKENLAEFTRIRPATVALLFTNVPTATLIFT